MRSKAYTIGDLYKKIPGAKQLPSKDVNFQETGGLPEMLYHIFKIATPEELMLEGQDKIDFLRLINKFIAFRVISPCLSGVYIPTVCTKEFGKGMLIIQFSNDGAQYFDIELRMRNWMVFDFTLEAL